MTKKNTIAMAALSDVGRVRSANEDRFVELHEVLGNPNIALAGAIDGVGGYAGGAEAANIAKTTIEEFVKTEQNTRDKEKLLRRAFVKANNLIYEERFVSPIFHKMSCVLSVGILDAESETLHYVHCGDSRAYIYRKGDLIKITKDHSLVGTLEDNGDLLEEDAMKHPRRNEIFKLLGEKELDENSEYFDSGFYSFYPNDIVLFCSDGLTDLVNKASIMETLENNLSLNEKCQQLVNKANALGGKDNITVVLVQYTNTTSSSQKHVETQPVKIEQSSVKRKNKLWIYFFLIAFLALSIFALYFYNNGNFDSLIKTKSDKKDSANSVSTPNVSPKVNKTSDLIVVDSTFYQGLAVKVRNGKVGYVNEADSVIIPFVYSNAQPFSEGLAAVKQNNLWGYIDLQGNIFIKPVFSHADPVKNNLIQAIFPGGSHIQIKISDKELVKQINSFQKD